jgi:hypothetical protein
MVVPPSTHGECLHLWTLPEHARGTFTTMMEIIMATRIVLVVAVLVTGVVVVAAAGMGIVGVVVLQVMVRVGHVPSR